MKPAGGLRTKIGYALLLLIAAGLAFGALMSPLLNNLVSPAPQVGQVAAEDIRAQAALSYTSAVLTEQRRADAAAAVQPINTPPDTSMAREQLERLRRALAFIASVRADSLASESQRLQDLAALEDVQLDQTVAANLLGLNEARWQAVQQESISVLEQLMRRSIRPENLADMRASIPGMVSLSLNEVQAEIVNELVAAFLAPNSYYSETLTETARQNAAQAVLPVTISFVPGQTVVRRGQVLSAADIEALDQLGLAQPERRIEDPISAGLLTGLVACLVVFYLRWAAPLPDQGRSLALIALLFLAFLFAARLTITGRTVIPYAYPLAAFGLVISALFGAQLAVITSLALSIMVAYGLANSLELTLFYMMGSLFGILALGNARRMASFIAAGLAVFLAGAATILVHRLLSPTWDWIGLATLTGAALFNGLASASMTLVLQFFLAQFLGMTTALQLIELTRPDHPLLRKLLHDAPGTYQHSLQVANLAEQAAEKIGADPLLTRVGALYHDAGKSLNPAYFIENQLPGFLNPHDDLAPTESAATIIQHVSDGQTLARQYRLPRRLIDFVLEHHGTMLTNYQYVRAVRQAGGDESLVDKESFRYPGPRPRSRETAILMLADGCEARVRAEAPKEDAVRELIKTEVDRRISLGQLSETDLTLQDLETIIDSFTATLRGIYHPRILYPQLEKSKNREITVPRGTAPGSSPVEAPTNAQIDHP